MIFFEKSSILLTPTRFELEVKFSAFTFFAENKLLCFLLFDMFVRRKGHLNASINFNLIINKGPQLQDFRKTGP